MRRAGFDDPYDIEREDQASFYEEARYHAIGIVENLLLVVVFSIVRTPFVLFQLGR